MNGLRPIIGGRPMLRFEAVFEGLAGAGEAGFDGAFGEFEEGCDFVVGKAINFAEDEDGARV